MCVSAHLEAFQFEMDEDAEDHITTDTKSPDLSSNSTQTWESPLCPPPWIISHQMEQNLQNHLTGMQSNPPSQVAEEFFCSSQSSASLIPLASTLVMSLWLGSDVVKQGYLGKLERNQKRYFVLRAGSHTGPSRLEWYKNEQKFTAMKTSSGKAALFGSSKQGLVKIALNGSTHVLNFLFIVVFSLIKLYLFIFNLG